MAKTAWRRRLHGKARTTNDAYVVVVHSPLATTYFGAALDAESALVLSLRGSSGHPNRVMHVSSLSLWRKPAPHGGSIQGGGLDAGSS